MDTIYKKGQLVKHPKKDDWGIGVVLKDCNGGTVDILFENEGVFRYSSLKFHSQIFVFIFG